MEYVMSNVPKLRFKEFSRNWDVTKLNKIAKKCNEKNKDESINDVFTNSAVNGIVAQRDFFDRDIANQNNLGGYYIVNHNDFIYNPRISISAPVGPLNRNHLQTGVMSPLYTVFKIDEDKANIDYLERYFKSSRWFKYMYSIANYGARSDRMNVTTNDFFAMPISLPSKQEQQKIASFLTSVDTKIEQLTRKEELLQQYKKGVMQKIFSQEIRFKADDGSEFCEWEEKKLGDVGITYNGLTGKTSENFGSGKPYIQYKQIFDNSKITIDGFGYVSIEPNEKQNKVQFGDIFFTTSSETPNEVGFASVLLDDIEEVYLNSFCFGYRAKSLDILNPYFARFLFRSDNFRRKVIELAQGSTRYNISKLELMKTLIQLPCLKEQIKIANFLSSIDSKIEQVQKQLDSTKEFKKALLQEMFI